MAEPTGPVKREEQLERWVAFTTPEERKEVLDKLSDEQRKKLMDFMQSARYDVERAIEGVTTEEEKQRQKEQVREEMREMKPEEIAELVEKVELIPPAIIVNPEKMAEILNKNLNLGVEEETIQQICDEYNEKKRDIFNKGEWPALREFLEKQGLTEKEINSKMDAAIMQAYRAEYPKGDLPPYVTSKLR